MPIKGYKTISVALTFLLAVLTSHDVQALIATYPQGFGSAVAVAVVLMRLVTTSPAMGITSVKVVDATPPQVAAQAQADLKYPRLDPKP